MPNCKGFAKAAGGHSGRKIIKWGIIVKGYLGVILVIYLRKVKVFDTFGTKIIKWRSSQRDFGLKKSKIWKITPYN